MYTSSSEEEAEENVDYEPKENEIGCRTEKVKNLVDSATAYHSVYTEEEAKEYLKKFTECMKNKDMAYARVLAR